MQYLCLIHNLTQSSYIMSQWAQISVKHQFCTYISPTTCAYMYNNDRDEHNWKLDVFIKDILTVD